jgi:hypothetical protein
MSKTATATVDKAIETANEEVFNRLISADPVLVDVAPAGEVIPGLEDRMILHAGPPVTWERTSGSMKGGAICMALFEGWAQTPEEAVDLLARGAIKLEPNHHHDAVGPMAGVTTRSLPVYVVENRTYGNRGHARLAEWLSQFGAYSPDAIEVLTRWRDLFAPTIRRGIQFLGGLELKPIIAKALQMGDELHNRPVAGSSLVANALAPALVQAGVATEDLVPTLYYLGRNEFLFLPIAMASAKSIADPARNVDHSSVVTAMARNGTEFGIRVSGLGDEWFTAPAVRLVNGLYIDGHTAEDAGTDMGDSTITETVGWGAFTLAGATAILSLTGGTPEEALKYSREMYQITVGTHPDYRIPALGFEGCPVGIDIRKVVDTGIVPILDTAVSHKEPGHPNIGGTLVRPPIEAFKRALAAFERKYVTG